MCREDVQDEGVNTIIISAGWGAKKYKMTAEEIVLEHGFIKDLLTWNQHFSGCRRTHHMYFCFEGYETLRKETKH